MTTKPRKFSPEVRERVVRMLQEHAGEYPTRHARSVHIALMGDPTLRIDPVRPPSNVVVMVNKAAAQCVLAEPR